MMVEELKAQMSKMRIEKHSFLNDTYMWVSKSREAIQYIKEKELVFEVPIAARPKKKRVIHRDDPIVALDRIVSRDIYFSAFVSCVSCMEDFFSKIVRMLLEFDNSKLNSTVSDVKVMSFPEDETEVEKQTEIALNIERLEKTLSYYSPIKYGGYLEETFNIKIDKTL